MVEKLLGNMGVPIKAQEMIYKVVFHAVNMYGSVIWVVVDRVVKVMNGFHHRISRRIVGDEHVEERWQVMGVGIGGRVAGGDRYLED